jgi:hypothetical protein
METDSCDLRDVLTRTGALKFFSASQEEDAPDEAGSKVGYEVSANGDGDSIFNDKTSIYDDADDEKDGSEDEEDEDDDEDNYLSPHGQRLKTKENAPCWAQAMYGGVVGEVQLPKDGKLVALSIMYGGVGGAIFESRRTRWMDLNLSALPIVPPEPQVMTYFKAYGRKRVKFVTDIKQIDEVYNAILTPEWKLSNGSHVLVRPSPPATGEDDTPPEYPQAPPTDGSASHNGGDGAEQLWITCEERDHILKRRKDPSGVGAEERDRKRRRIEEEAA